MVLAPLLNLILRFGVGGSDRNPATAYAAKINPLVFHAIDLRPADTESSL